MPASLIDNKIVDVSNLNYSAWSVVVYQRSTVILSELLLGAAILSFVRATPGSTTPSTIAASLFMHPGLLIIDHIHFQYNGFLFGILLWSIYYAQKGNHLVSGILFAVLLNFKHIYMYLAPAYFIYLLRVYCMTPQGSFVVERFITLGGAVASVFTISLGPFALRGQIPQLLTRLFPFSRGLNHAYWAPNVWALLTALDRILIFSTKKLGLSVTLNSAGVNSTSRGLVGDTVFGVIPDVQPIHTFAITIALQMVFLIKLWSRPTYRSFLTAVTLSAYTSFLFGWHVHEKAVLLVLMPLSLLAADNRDQFRTFVICSSAGIFGLFPLIFTPAEEAIVLLYSLLWALMIYGALDRQIPQTTGKSAPSYLDRIERLYLWGIPLIRVVTLMMSLSTAPEYEFLPLMLTSVYCAVGTCWAFLRLSVLYIRQ